MCFELSCYVIEKDINNKGRKEIDTHKERRTSFRSCAEMNWFIISKLFVIILMEYNYLQQFQQVSESLW